MRTISTVTGRNEWRFLYSYVIIEDTRKQEMYGTQLINNTLFYLARHARTLFPTVV